MREAAGGTKMTNPEGEGRGKKKGSNIAGAEEKEEAVTHPKPKPHGGARQAQRERGHLEPGKGYDLKINEWLLYAINRLTTYLRNQGHLSNTEIPALNRRPGKESLGAAPRLCV